MMPGTIIILTTFTDRTTQVWEIHMKLCRTSQFVALGVDVARAHMPVMSADVLATSTHRTTLIRKEDLKGSRA